MSPHRLRALATALILTVAALTLNACDEDGPSIGHLLDSTLTPSPTATIEASATPTTPPATTAPGATPTSPPATPTPAPAQNPTTEKPRVLWMLRSSGGTNLAVVRFATNVDTTAVLSLSATPGTPTGVDPQTDANFAREHTISIPLGQANVPTSISLDVTDRQGGKATANLEAGATIVGTQYWARTDAFKPAFAWTAPFKGTATWNNILGSPPGPPAGSIQVFAKKAGCTTAEACQATFVGAATNDTRNTFEGGEKHTIPVELPSSPDQDFQLLYSVIIDNGGQVISLFYQRDVPRAAAAAGKD